jgi:type I restriction enzyme R subunit
MSELLDALDRAAQAGGARYQDYLAKIVELTRQAKAGPTAGGYPATLKTTAAKRALYDNLGRTRPWRSAWTRLCAPACRTTGAATP